MGDLTDSDKIGQCLDHQRRNRCAAGTVRGGSTGNHGFHPFPALMSGTGARRETSQPDQITPKDNPGSDF